MSNKQQPKESANSELKVVSKCPNCFARVFQGPYHRGEIINGEFSETETLYQCMGCHMIVSAKELIS